MNLRTIPRTAVDASLRTARLPLDLVLRGSAVHAIDRADATARGVAGFLLRDDVLRDDAQKRLRAVNLRQEAELRAERGAEEAQTHAQKATRRRRQATERVRTEHKRAEEQREQRTKAAAGAQQRRRSANERAAAEAEDKIEARNRRTKLEALEKEAEALSEREAALTARDEAERLASAAGRAKAERKSS